MWGIQVLTCLSVVSPSLITLNPSEFQRFSPYLPTRPSKRILLVKASTGETQSQPPSSSGRKNPIGVLLDVPKSIWRQTLRPMSDFGFGRKSIWEGGVGLFMVSGAVLLALSLVWLRGFQLRSRMRKYEAVFEFSQACGICTGTPVRIRGVNVGNVIRLNPSLRSIEAVVEVEDDKIIIPQNSLIEVNQSGLLMETMIDITPRDPLPTPSVGPLHSDCVKEGLIVCDRQKIKGHQGVSLDALVGIFTRLGREMEEIGISKTYMLAERVALVIQEAQPLLAKFEAMAEDVQPLLAEVRDSGLLKEVESLTRTLTKATEDLRSVNSSVLTPENTERIRKSIYSFLFTLKNIEHFVHIFTYYDFQLSKWMSLLLVSDSQLSLRRMRWFFSTFIIFDVLILQNISSDVSGFTGDEATRRNLKLLIKSLSRLL
ncbi:hypothetical protein GIB67_040483 [Kingdonia uniflora]|uniref:Mce/MlaD domain-containing protein n=1 Tax=Kingdonia uniflora TaxID=39325 RepID=A0A7J7L571_9MAGN|nr:hypothetical protein GIB67_040483 [Kingdonia uniflora]